MSYLAKARQQQATAPREIGVLKREDAEELAIWHEKQKQPFQAVRVRLLYGLYQRKGHEEMVEKWLNGKALRHCDIPPVPGYRI